jgi:hypothetical protein
VSTDWPFSQQPLDALVSIDRGFISGRFPSKTMRPVTEPVTSSATASSSGEVKAAFATARERAAAAAMPRKVLMVKGSRQGSWRSPST